MEPTPYDLLPPAGPQPAQEAPEDGPAYEGTPEWARALQRSYREQRREWYARQKKVAK